MFRLGYLFSYTFQSVQDNSEKVWRFYRYGLINEYNEKPMLVPPLIILSLIWILVKYTYFQCCSSKAHKKDNYFSYNLSKYIASSIWHSNRNILICASLPILHLIDIGLGAIN